MNTESLLRGGPSDEARRILNICNACRYCEGLCATFQAMTTRRDFGQGDLDYLANLCHNCTACYHDCQYAPPHEFAVNVPRALADLRLDSYRAFAWPRSLARLFERNGLIVSVVAGLSLAIVMIVLFLWQEPDILFASHRGPGAFYAVIGHGTMVAVAGATFGFSLLALAMGFVRFRRQAPATTRRPGSWFGALRYASTLRYLDGGHGEGCNTSRDSFSNRRRYYHQMTMWGFLLCFAATAVATIYHYGLGVGAPYPLSSLPVVLGTLGGVGLLIGPVGLFREKAKSDPRPASITQYGMDYAFLALLFLVSLSGMLLLGLRETDAMGVLLAAHLGFVLALFLALPYSKFVHAIYRLAALVRFTAEQDD